MTLGISKAAQEIKWPRLKDVGEAGTYRKIRVVDLKKELISEFLYYIFDKYNTTQHPKIKDLPFILEKAEQANPEFKDNIQNAAKLAMKSIKNMTISDVQKNRGIDFNLPDKLKEYTLQLKVKDMLDYDVDELFDTAEYSPDKEGKPKAELRRGEIEGLSGNEYASHFENIYKEKIDDRKYKNYESRKKRYLQMPEKTEKEKKEKDKTLRSIERMDNSKIKFITIDENKSKGKENKLKELGYKFLTVTSLSRDGSRKENTEALLGQDSPIIPKEQMKEYKKVKINTDVFENIISQIGQFEGIGKGRDIEDVVSEIIDYLEDEDFIGSPVPKETIRLFRKFALNRKGQFYKSFFKQIKDRSSEIKLVLQLEGLFDTINEFSSMLKEKEEDLFEDIEDDLSPFIFNIKEIESIILGMETAGEEDLEKEKELKEKMEDIKKDIRKKKSVISDKEQERKKLLRTKSKNTSEIKALQANIEKDFADSPKLIRELKEDIRELEKENKKLTKEIEKSTEEIEKLTEETEKFVETVNLVLREYKPIKSKLDTIRETKSAKKLILYLTSGSKKERSKKIDTFLKSLEEIIDEKIKENKPKNKELAEKLKNQIENTLFTSDINLDRLDELIKKIEKEKKLDIVFASIESEKMGKKYLIDYYQEFVKNPNQTGLDKIFKILFNLKKKIIGTMKKEDKKAEKEIKELLTMKPSKNVFNNKLAEEIYNKPKEKIKKMFSSLLRDLSGKYNMKFIIKKMISVEIDDKKEIKEEVFYQFDTKSKYSRVTDIGYRRVPKGIGGGEKEGGFTPFPKKFTSTEIKIDKLTQRNLDRFLQKIKIKVENLEDSI